MKLKLYIVLVVLFATILFYLVCPKYEYIKYPDTIVRLNKITGGVKTLGGKDGEVKFITLEEYSTLKEKQLKESTTKKFFDN